MIHSAHAISAASARHLAHPHGAGAQAAKTVHVVSAEQKVGIAAHLAVQAESTTTPARSTRPAVYL